ncbi:MAG: hypothetical protein RBR35_13235 [Salinivirgaceae bacterium]|nr:hypothetical protein [Salinivirgaceae bacterium]
MRYIQLSIILITSFVKAQEVNFLDKNKEYHYKAVYIDKSGDTITNEKLILWPLCKPWIGQPWLQTAIRYKYHPNPEQYKNYIDPDDFFHKKDVRHLKRKGKIRAHRNETTGAIINENAFYIHPPRGNQYRMLFYAPHPWIHHGYYFDSIFPYHFQLRIYGVGIFHQIYNATILPDTILFGRQVKMWELHVPSTGEIKERFVAKDMFNSTLDALFTREFGFIKMHYTFENGIRILFDLEKVVEL